MTDERAPLSPAPCVQIRISWGETVLEVAHLEVPRDFDLAALARACGPGSLPVVGGVRGALLEVDGGGWPCLVLEDDRPTMLQGAPIDVEEHAEDLVVLPSERRGLRLRLGDRATVSVLGMDVTLLAIDPDRTPPRARARFDRRSTMVAAGVIAAHVGLAAFCMQDMETTDAAAQGEPTSAQIAEMQRLLKVAAENDELAADAVEGEGTGEESEGGSGVRARGEEGSMGGTGARSTGNRFGVRGPAARQQALAEAAEFGMIGLLNTGASGDPNAPTAPWGRDDAKAGEGVGRNAPGGPSGPPASKAAAAPRAQTPAPLDPNGRFATTYRPGRGHLASFEAALARGVIPPAARELVSDVAAGGEVELAAPTDRALAWSADFERSRPAAAGGSNHLRLALRSAAKSAGRPRLSVHLAFDTSGSMEGEAMDRAKQAARELVGRLAPTDDFSLVAFSSGAEVKVPEGLVGPRRAAIQSVIDGLRADGGTNISEGLRLAYAEARGPKVPKDAVRVVWLMSDGKPSGGISNRDQLARLALDAFQDGIQTSSFGLGADYDGALMSQIAADGAGGYYYVARPDHIGAALATELEKRLDPVALGVEVRVRLKPDVKLLSVYGSRRLGADESAKVREQEVAVDTLAAAKNGIARDREDDTEGGLRFFIPAFGRDDAHAILLQLELPAGAGENGVASVEVKYKDLLKHDNAIEERSLRLRWADGDAESAASADRPMRRAIQRFAAGQDLANAAARVQAGEGAGALALLDERIGILRHAASSLGEPSLDGDADRLGRLRAFIDPGGDPGGRARDVHALAMLVDAAGQSRLR